MTAGRLENVQKAYENNLGFRQGQTVLVYTGGVRHTFRGVANLRINIGDSILTIEAPGGNTVFHSWSGIGVVDAEQAGTFELKQMS